MFVRLLCWLSKSAKVSQEDRMRITNTLLSTVGALPIHATFTVDESNRLLIRGVPLDYEKATVLRENAATVLHSQVWNLVREQVLYEAVSKGIHEALNSDQVLFAKAAIWFCEQQDKALKEIAMEPGNLHLSGD